jgi:hypothetical protein
MPHRERIGETTIRRSLDERRVLSLAEGRFEPIFRAYDEHVRRWELPADGLTVALARDGLAAIALHLSTRPSDETIGVTINIQTPPLNLFLGGDAGERRVTTRAFTENVQTASSNRLFVESYRPEVGPTLSSMDVVGVDVFRMFEEFYTRSEQLAARFVALGDDRYGLVRALPDGGRERLEAMTREDAAALFEGPTDLLEEKPIRFRCGCTPERIIRVLRGMFEGRGAELFHQEPAVEAFCPRCGARWWIERAKFDAAGGEA